MYFTTIKALFLLPLLVCYQVSGFPGSDNEAQQGTNSASTTLRMSAMMLIDSKGQVLSKSPGSGPHDRLSELYSLGSTGSFQNNSNTNETAALPIRYVGMFRRYPDMDDKDTLLSLIEMCGIAYTILPDDPAMHKAEDPEEPFGHQDSLRGLVYSDRMNRVVVIAFKGTSPYILRWAQDESSWKDQLNDNAMFGCCHGTSLRKQNSSSCKVANDVCDSNCHQNYTRNYEYSYIKEAEAIYTQIKRRFPFSSIWLTGHSLGGSIAAIIAAKYSRPAITFNAVGELFAGHRLGIKPFGHTPPKTNMWGVPYPDYSAINAKLPIYHFGNTLDPVYSGNAEFLKVFNYNLETKCHYGHICPLDLKSRPNDPKKEILLKNETETANRFVDRAKKLIGSVPKLVKRIREEIIRLGFRPQLYLLYMYFHSLTAVADSLARWETAPNCTVAPACDDCRNWRYGAF